MKFFLTLITNKKSQHLLLLGAIVILAIFFRFYNTPNRYGFDPDPTRDALIIYQGARSLHFPLVGAASGIAPFTFGPWYYYQLILIQIIFPFTYSPWIFIGLSSVFVSIILYKSGALLEGNRFGLLLAFLAAISPSETGQTQGLSNPDLIPFYAAAVIFIFIYIYKKKSSSWLIFIWGVTLAIGINIHYQMLGLGILPILYFFFRRNHIFKYLPLFSLGFMLPWIPLFIFNLNHNWHTVSGILYFMHHHPYTPNNWRIYLFSFWLPYWGYILGVPSLLGIIFGVFVIGVLARLIFLKKFSNVYIILILSFLVNFFLLRYLIAQRDYYYYLYLHPFVFIFFSLMLWQFRKIRFGYLLIGSIITIMGIYMLQGDVIRLQTRQDQIQMRDDAQQLINRFPRKKLSLYICAGEQKNKLQGIEFFLIHTNNNMLANDDTGIRIGLRNDDSMGQSCLPKKDLSKNEGQFEQLTQYSSSQLNRFGWKLVNPQSVYHDSLAWWE